MFSILLIPNFYAAFFSSSFSARTSSIRCVNILVCVSGAVEGIVGVIEGLVGVVKDTPSDRLIFDVYIPCDLIPYPGEA